MLHRPSRDDGFGLRANGVRSSRGESYVSKSNADRAVARIAEMIRDGVATAE